MRLRAGALFVAVLTSCPSLGPLKIKCRDDLDCPAPARCVSTFCSEHEGSGGGSAGGGVAGGGVAGGGSAGGSAGGSGFCRSRSPAPKFCADFDEPDADVDFERWGGRYDGDAGYVVLDTQHVASAPRSMNVVIQPQSGGCIFAIGYKGLDTDGGPQRAKLAFSGRWPSGGYLGPFAQLGLEGFGSDGGLCQAVLSGFGGSFDVLEQGQRAASAYSHTHNSPAVVPRDTFVRLEIDYDLTARRMVLRVDGGVVLDEGFTVPCPYGPMTRIGFALGFWCINSPSAAQRLWFDDVTLDFQ